MEKRYIMPSSEGDFTMEVKDHPGYSNVIVTAPSHMASFNMAEETTWGRHNEFFERQVYQIVKALEDNGFHVSHDAQAKGAPMRIHLGLHTTHTKSVSENPLIANNIIQELLARELITAKEVEVPETAKVPSKAERASTPEADVKSFLDSKFPDRILDVKSVYAVIVPRDFSRKNFAQIGIQDNDIITRKPAGEIADKVLIKASALDRLVAQSKDAGRSGGGIA